MVWGAIDTEEKSDLVNVDGNFMAARYVDEIINPEVVPLFARRDNLVYMHDNARPHAARLTNNHLANMGIPVLPWPSKSPDLNPIEHLWDVWTGESGIVLTHQQIFRNCGLHYMLSGREFLVGSGGASSIQCDDDSTLNINVYE